MQYAVLLRGINVGGKNIIKMTELTACLDAAGLDNVATYIQSGNVLFESTQIKTAIEQTIKNALAKTFTYQAPFVVLSLQELRAVVKEAPKGFGSDPAAYRYDCIFLKAPLTAAEALQNTPIKEGVDEVAAGPDVLYFSRLAAKATSSRISRIVSMPMYQNMTIRNWNTTTKLLALMEARA